jgi:hypothetical protein
MKPKPLTRDAVAELLSLVQLAENYADVTLETDEDADKPVWRATRTLARRWGRKLSKQLSMMPTKEERAESLDSLADNETADEAEYGRLRRAAQRARKA